MAQDSFGCITPYDRQYYALTVNNKNHTDWESRRPMVSPYLERRLRSYREALREIRKRHAAKRAIRAKEKSAARKTAHLRLIQSNPADQKRPGKDE